MGTGIVRSSTLVLISLLSLLGFAAVAQTPSAPQRKEIRDPAEYNDYVIAAQQTVAAAKVSGWEAFLTKYPDSIMKEDALEALMSAYQQTGNQAKTLDTAQRVLATKSADDGPNLEVTMKFIQDKLNAIGPVNYVAHMHNTKGDDWTNQFKVEISKVVADPTACRISFHWKAERDGTSLGDADNSNNLKVVEDIVMLPREQDLNDRAKAAGHPEVNARVDPPVFLLQLRKAKETSIVGVFSDEQLVDRVAKALVHAVELCGGGSKPEPF